MTHSNSPFSLWCRAGHQQAPVCYCLSDMFGDGPTTWHQAGHCVNTNTCLAALDHLCIVFYCLSHSLTNTEIVCLDIKMSNYLHPPASKNMKYGLWSTKFYLGLQDTQRYFLEMFRYHAQSSFSAVMEAFPILVSEL